MVRIILHVSRFPQLCSESFNVRIMENVKNTDRILGNVEFNRFGLISMILLVVGCLGGLTVGLGAVEQVWSLTLVVIPTMTTLSLLLAVAPMRYIITSAIVASIIDVLFIAYYLLS